MFTKCYIKNSSIEMFVGIPLQNTPRLDLFSQIQNRTIPSEDHDALYGINIEKGSRKPLRIGPGRLEVPLGD
jgi:hypothetical protein